MKKIAVYSYFGKLLNSVRPRKARTLIRDLQADYDKFGDLRFLHPTEQECAESNEYLITFRDSVRDLPMPDHLKRYFATWDEIFSQIDDGRRWHAQQSASRTSKGAAYSGIGQRPSVMTFA